MKARIPKPSKQTAEDYARLSEEARQKAASGEMSVFESQVWLSHQIHDQRDFAKWIINNMHDQLDKRAAALFDDDGNAVITPENTDNATAILNNTN